MEKEKQIRDCFQIEISKINIAKRNQPNFGSFQEGCDMQLSYKVWLCPQTWKPSTKHSSLEMEGGRTKRKRKRKTVMVVY